MAQVNATKAKLAELPEGDLSAPTLDSVIDRERRSFERSWTTATTGETLEYKQAAAKLLPEQLTKLKEVLKRAEAHIQQAAENKPE